MVDSIGAASFRDEMNRREFLKRTAALGLVLPTTGFIFDMGANLHKYAPRKLSRAIVIAKRELKYADEFLNIEMLWNPEKPVLIGSLVASESELKNPYEVIDIRFIEII